LKRLSKAKRRILPRGEDSTGIQTRPDCQLRKNLVATY
jgi:hypothetical protein